MEKLLWVFIILVVSYYLIMKQDDKVETVCILGMGDCGVTQRSVNELVNTVTTNVIQENAQNCGASTGVDQMIKISDLNAGGDINISNITQDSNVKFNFSCMQEASNQANLETQLANSVRSELDQLTSGYQFQPSEQEQINTTKNNITTNLTSRNLAECTSRMFSNQETIINNLNAKRNININNIAQTAILDVASTCNQSNQNLQNAITSLETEISAKGKQEAKGVDIFASLASLGTFALPLIIAIVLSFLSVAMFFVMSGDVGEMSPMNQMSRQMNQ